MCGVVACVTIDGIDTQTREDVFSLITEAKIRGLHSFGYVYIDKYGRYYDDRFHTMEYLLRDLQDLPEDTLDIILHARYCTSGDWRVLANNQPLVVGKYALCFNGVIDMGTKEQMEQRWGVSLETDNDGELFIKALQHGEDPGHFVENITGSFAGVWYDNTGPDVEIYALRNERRPLYWVMPYDGILYVASTRDIIKRALGGDIAAEAEQLEPGKVYNLGEMVYAD